MSPQQGRVRVFGADGAWTAHRDPQLEEHYVYFAEFAPGIGDERRSVWHLSLQDTDAIATRAAHYWLANRATTAA